MSRTRLNLYVPIAQAFSSNVVSFHSAVAARLGLHVTDLTSLRLLEKGPLAAGELGQQLGLTGAAATALIDRLERAGYAVRERSAEDRRRISVRANPERLRDIHSLYEGQRAAMSKVLEKYSEADFSVIASFLKQTTEVLADEERKIIVPMRNSSDK